MSKPPRQSLLPFKPLKPKSVIDPVRSIVLKILSTPHVFSWDVLVILRVQTLASDSILML
jgi:hypothetical protein